MGGTLFFVPISKNMIKNVFLIMFFLIGGTKNNLPYISLNLEYKIIKN